MNPDRLHVLTQEAQALATLCQTLTLVRVTAAEAIDGVRERAARELAEHIESELRTALRRFAPHTSRGRVF